MLSGFGESSSYYKVVNANTAVFPIPLFAWQIMSVPIIAWGMHSYYTSLGCSKPQSVMALRSSGLNRKSLNPVLIIPVN